LPNDKVIYQNNCLDFELIANYNMIASFMKGFTTVFPLINNSFAPAWWHHYFCRDLFKTCRTGKFTKDTSRMTYGKPMEYCGFFDFLGLSYRKL